ncbi:hypothetical protein T484DRAFT_1948432 [Baffinella frigidus]|nr:hypothetical protein T484DRAFT_1948426 [Cryptophyta sp. CCMP2293]KAJ1484198.1 hypothetical protein T484DRAFT_1948432 [Cryptophyta sp. CCMP2293]
MHGERSFERCQHGHAQRLRAPPPHTLYTPSAHPPCTLRTPSMHSPWRGLMRTPRCPRAYC